MWWSYENDHRRWSKRHGKLKIPERNGNSSWEHYKMGGFIHPPTARPKKNMDWIYSYPFSWVLEGSKSYLFWRVSLGGRYMHGRRGHAIAWTMLKWRRELQVELLSERKHTSQDQFEARYLGKPRVARAIIVWFPNTFGSVPHVSHHLKASNLRPARRWMKGNPKAG